jgi:hypothetical protein
MQKPYTKLVLGVHNQIDPAYLDDHQFVSKLQNLSRSMVYFDEVFKSTIKPKTYNSDSKSLLHSLAKKFSLSNGNARLSSKPISYPEPPNDELAYGSQHQNPI